MVFRKNRQRLLDGDLAHLFFDIAAEHARVLGLLSSEPFTVDGKLLEAWAGTRSYQGIRPKSWGSFLSCGPAFQRVQPPGKAAAAKNDRPMMTTEAAG